MSTRRRYTSIGLHLLLAFILCDEDYPPRNVRIITESEPREYQCVVTANPPPTAFIWSRDGQALPLGVKPKWDRLHFPDLTSDFNGIYRCEVTNPLGSAIGFITRHVVQTTDDPNHVEL